MSASPTNMTLVTVAVGSRVLTNFCIPIFIPYMDGFGVCKWWMVHSVDDSIDDGSSLGPSSRP